MEKFTTFPTPITNIYLMSNREKLTHLQIGIVLYLNISLTRDVPNRIEDISQIALELEVLSLCNWDP